MSSPKRRVAFVILAATFIYVSVGFKAEAQPRSSQSNDDELVKVQTQRNGVRTVTIPITIRHKGDRASMQELTPVGMLTLREDGDDQKILSIRAMGIDTPITVAVLIQ